MPLEQPPIAEAVSSGYRLTDTDLTKLPLPRIAASDEVANYIWAWSDAPYSASPGFKKITSHQDLKDNAVAAWADLSKACAVFHTNVSDPKFKNLTIVKSGNRLDYKEEVLSGGVKA